MSMNNQISTVAVCGAGTMGAGIAQVAAGKGFKTILYDLQDAVIEKAADKIRQQLQKLVDKGKISSDQQAQTLSNLSFTTDISSCKAEVIIEAIVENVAVKVELFSKLAAINDPGTILCSNTSSLPIKEIAAGLPQPERVVGMHFFNPAPVMKLVEVVSAEQTATEVAEKIYGLAKQFGKTPVHVKDSPGFIVNRVARHYYLEAMQVAGQGVADIASIDRLMVSLGFKMGPFELMDLIGNDVNLAVSQSLYDAFGKAERFKPGALQVEKVAAGELGRKTGKGFYDYQNR
ncbi:3-hydroxybutyryl-CoA dehydrogenase [Chitinophaga caeni]|uniref:3-hydroxybutyryl-CoA dehydrogenase n=2 Tax=Chitinophaga caeni TaxID=2029983 RepID=A0A291QRA6_9BACT|nr:3-hydroxybutyryl-CoA dehydrogenase [Chitinophaga caeni]